MNLDYLFHPRSIAVAGVSGDLAAWNGGRLLMQSLIDFGFKGKIYPVSPGGGEVYGLQIYKTIKDIPGSIDYVISAIPAQYTPQLVSECAAKSVKAIHFFTSGFSEVEDEEGKRLESEILRLAHQNNIRILGPNCMGLYCPKTGLSFAVDFPEQQGLPRQHGPVGFISQSGGNSMYCAREGAARGVYFSKIISYGNAIDLNETDFLEYLTNDPETRIIMAYIEGVRDGSRFMKALKIATRTKPVIILKVGATEGGTRAAASHTGSMAGSNRIWASLLKQVGAIQVFSIEEMIDVALLLLRSSPPKGRNAAVIGMGGGANVLAADDCSNAGLTLPMLPAQIRQKLKEISTSEAGRFFVNPVDLNISQFDMLAEAITTIAHCNDVDLLILHIALDIWAMVNPKAIVKPFVSAVIKSQAALNKPMVVVVHSQVTGRAQQLGPEAFASLIETGLPTYPSFVRAATAISRFIQYHE